MIMPTVEPQAAPANESAPNWFWVASLYATVVAAAIAVPRRFFGVDFTDESYYVALARRFSTGDRLFVDEISLAQGTAYFMTPFVALHHLLFGSDTGLVLFMRFVQLGFAASIGVTVYFFAVRWIRKPAALLACAAIVLPVPFNIPNLSYNSLGAGWLSLGLLWLGLADAEPNARIRNRWLAASGFGLSAAAMSYPPLAIVACLAYIGGIWFMTGRRTASATFLALGAAIPAAALILALSLAGTSNLSELRQFAQSIKASEDPLLKIGHGVSLLFSGTPLGWWAAGGILGLLTGLWARWPVMAGPLVVSLFIAAGFSPIFQEIYSSLGYVTYVGLLLPFLLPGLRSAPALRRYALLVFGIALFGGIVTMWSSTNGYINFAIGFAPAFLVSMVVAFYILEHLFSNRHVASVFQLILGLVLVGTLGWSLWNGFYRDDRLPELTTQVKTGAYAGLWTTESKVSFIDSLARDLIDAGLHGKGVFFFDAFPGGYLLTSLRPATNTLWVVSDPAFPRNIVPRFWDRTKMPDVAVQMKQLQRPGMGNIDLRYAADDPILQHLSAAGFTTAVLKADYAIWVRQPGR